MSSGLRVVMTTLPSREAAVQLAQLVVESGHAACVNIVGSVQSVYSWQGKIENSQEFLLLIKTTDEGYLRLERAILEHHPYELPEIIAVSMVDGFRPYLQWVADNVSALAK